MDWEMISAAILTLGPQLCSEYRIQGMHKSGPKHVYGEGWLGEDQLINNTGQLS